MPAIAGHCAENTPTQGMHYIHTWPRPIHNTLVVPEQPCRKQGPGNHWHEHKHECDHHINKLARHTGMQAATIEDTHQQKVKSYKIQGWVYKKDEVEHSIVM